MKISRTRTKVGYKYPLRLAPFRFLRIANGFIELLLVKQLMATGRAGHRMGVVPSHAVVVHRPGVEPALTPLRSIWARTVQGCLPSHNNAIPTIVPVCITNLSTTFYHAEI